MVGMLCELIEFSETFSRPNNRINIDRNASFLSFCLEVMMLWRVIVARFVSCSLVHHFTFGQRTMLSIMLKIYDANVVVKHILMLVEMPITCLNDEIYRN